MLQRRFCAALALFPHSWHLASVTQNRASSLQSEWRDALRLGMDSVLVDGSALAYEANLSLTKQAVQVRLRRGRDVLWRSWEVCTLTVADMAQVQECHARGLAVEAEIGRLSGTEDGLTVSEYEARLTDPLRAAEFVAETGVDMLAVCIGNVHGK